VPATHSTAARTGQRCACFSTVQLVSNDGRRGSNTYRATSTTANGTSARQRIRITARGAVEGVAVFALFVAIQNYHKRSTAWPGLIAGEEVGGNMAARHAHARDHSPVVRNHSVGSGQIKMTRRVIRHFFFYGVGGQKASQPAPAS